jgi:hypothetical protein
MTTRTSHYDFCNHESIPNTVIPAKAGIHFCHLIRVISWQPRYSLMDSRLRGNDSMVRTDGVVVRRPNA